jgi:hypothetical protein
MHVVEEPSTKNQKSNPMPFSGGISFRTSRGDQLSCSSFGFSPDENSCQINQGKVERYGLPTLGGIALNQKVPSAPAHF